MNTAIVTGGVKGIGFADDIAAMVAFLTSDHARFITGQVFFTWMAGRVSVQR